MAAILSEGCRPRRRRHLPDLTGHHRRPLQPSRARRVQGLFGAVFALASILGPAIGGFPHRLASWHWAFFVNLPLGIVALFVLWRLLPSVRHPEAVRSIDYLGAGPSSPPPSCRSSWA